MNIRQLITKSKTLPGCRVLPSNGIPAVNQSHLPGDLKEFYQLCGGLVLYEDAEYPIYIVSPGEFILANPVIVGELCEEDISSNWYIICNDGNGEYLTIDVHPNRLGRCYDSFFDRHGVVGESQIIATSFTDLLERLINNNGEYWYWLKDGSEYLGDAYDDLEGE